MCSRTRLADAEGTAVKSICTGAAGSVDNIQIRLHQCFFTGLRLPGSWLSEGCGSPPRDLITRIRLSCIELPGVGRTQILPSITSAPWIYILNADHLDGDPVGKHGAFADVQHIQVSTEVE